MKYSDDVIGNMGETPLNINMSPNFTISQKRKIKKINIRQQKINEEYDSNACYTMDIMIIWNQNIWRK